MDLIEHEIGHALGWPHSGYDASLTEPTQSALDVMSNSAAPRDASTRTAATHPDTLAINRLEAGWLPGSAVAVVPPTGATVTLSPVERHVGHAPGRRRTRRSTASSPSSCSTADGFDDHLPATGVAVHLIEGSDATRTQTPLVGLAPYDRSADDRRDA